MIWASPFQLKRGTKQCKIPSNMKQSLMNELSTVSQSTNLYIKRLVSYFGLMTCAKSENSQKSELNEDRQHDYYKVG